MNKEFTKEEAKEIANKIGLDFAKVRFSLEEFWSGLAVELEHGSADPETNVTNSDPVMTGKIAWAHLKEYPDYYDRLEKLEKEAEAFWGKTTNH